MDEREKRFDELDAEIEKWSEDEKNFVRWLLLREYESKLEFPNQMESKNDFATYKLIERLKKSCNELIEMLSWELWR